MLHFQSWIWKRVIYPTSGIRISPLATLPRQAYWNRVTLKFPVLILTQKGSLSWSLISLRFRWTDWQSLFLLISFIPSVYTLLWLSPLHLVAWDCPIIDVKRERAGSSDLQEQHRVEALLCWLLYQTLCPAHMGIHSVYRILLVCRRPGASRVRHPLGMQEARNPFSRSHSLSMQKSQGCSLALKQQTIEFIVQSRSQGDFSALSL